MKSPLMPLPVIQEMFSNIAAEIMMATVKNNKWQQIHSIIIISSDNATEKG